MLSSYVSQHIHKKRIFGDARNGELLTFINSDFTEKTKDLLKENGFSLLFCLTKYRSLTVGIILFEEAVHYSIL